MQFSRSGALLGHAHAAFTVHPLEIRRKGWWDLGVRAIRNGQPLEKDVESKVFLLEKGDVDAAWAQAAHIVEGEYRTGAQEHLYIENNGVIAEWSEQNGITVWGSLQCPYYVHKSLLAVLDLPEEKVRVIQTETGGAFGWKEDYPSTLASHAALLAMKRLTQTASFFCP